MRRDNVPAGGLKYWISLCAASVLACNIGDLFAPTVGLLDGPPLLAAGFAAILCLERTARRPTFAWYWLAIVVVQTAATNLADLSSQLLGTAVAPAALTGLLGATLLARAVRDGKAPRRKSDDATPSVDGLYWLCMLIAGTVGTALGDVTSLASGLGLPGAAAVLSGLAASLVAARSTGSRASILPFWLVVVAIRAAGTSVADLSVQQTDLGSAAAVAAIVLACVLFFRTKPRLRLSNPAGASGGASFEGGRALSPAFTSPRPHPTRQAGSERIELRGQSTVIWA